MGNTTRSGSTYRARSYDLHLTRARDRRLTLRRFGVVVMLVPTFAVAWMVAVQVGLL